MRRFIFIGYVVFLAGLSSFAQESIVQGRILDTNSSEPIPDVTVSLQNSIFSTTTDAEGFFSFSQETLPQGEQVLEISKEGYNSLKIPVTIQSDAPVNLKSILLSVDLQEIEEQYYASITISQRRKDFLR